MAEYEDLEDDGRQILLSASDSNDEDSMTEYSQYAKDKYGMPDTFS